MSALEMVRVLGFLFQPKGEHIGSPLRYVVKKEKRLPTKCAYSVNVLHAVPYVPFLASQVKRLLLKVKGTFILDAGMR